MDYINTVISYTYIGKTLYSREGVTVSNAIPVTIVVAVLHGKLTRKYSMLEH